MPRDYHAAKRDILQSMPGTMEELATRSGWARPTVEKWVARLRKDNQCRAGDWAPANGPGPFVMVHYAGRGPDVKCKFKPLSKGEASRRYRAKRWVNILSKPRKEIAPPD